MRLTAPECDRCRHWYNNNMLTDLSNRAIESIEGFGEAIGDFAKKH